MGARAPKVRRGRVYTRLSHPLRQRLLAYCAAVGRSERAVIKDAVERYLANPGKDMMAEGPIDRLARAIDDAERLRERQHRDIELLSEAFGRFLRLWTIVHAGVFTQPATAESREAMAKQRDAGEALYERLATSVANHFRRGHHLADDMPNLDERTERVQKP
jgi:predicted DNA-binding protein